MRSSESFGITEFETAVLLFRKSYIRVVCEGRCEMLEFYNCVLEFNYVFHVS
jgi:hypothetical protein